jgi:hypothetical protein
VGGAVRLLIVVTALIATPLAVWTYPRYNDGCQTCHGEFTAEGYSSASTGVAWPDSLHDVHRSQNHMATDCDLCHLDGDNYNPYITQSNGTGYNLGYGCMGCHGSPTDAGAPTGDSLQRHHIYSGIDQCLGCHDPAAAGAQESQAPPYYGTPDTNVGSPCNDDASTSEDWNDDVEGLDNDGDLLYDGDDPGCQEGFLFHDGFVSGGASAWSFRTPAP